MRTQWWRLDNPQHVVKTGEVNEIHFILPRNVKVENVPWEISQVPKQSNDSWIIVYEDKGTADCRSKHLGVLVNCGSISKKEKLWKSQGVS